MFKQITIIDSTDHDNIRKAIANCNLNVYIECKSVGCGYEVSFDLGNADDHWPLETLAKRVKALYGWVPCAKALKEVILAAAIANGWKGECSNFRLKF